MIPQEFNPCSITIAPLVRPSPVRMEALQPVAIQLMRSCYEDSDVQLRSKIMTGRVQACPIFDKIQKDKISPPQARLTKFGDWLKCSRSMRPEPVSRKGVRVHDRTEDVW